MAATIQKADTYFATRAGAPAVWTSQQDEKKTAAFQSAVNRLEAVVWARSLEATYGWLTNEADDAIDVPDQVEQAVYELSEHYLGEDINLLDAVLQQRDIGPIVKENVVLHPMLSDLPFYIQALVFPFIVQEMAVSVDSVELAVNAGPIRPINFGH